ncbi:hypothetical protein L6452_16570 [Arctium lappa]|uniref:Uncharacterized protein n=1 Tax=Arctium lappa TaxID=4217 RepID=A0ACB9C1C0_ARCLA|nr:hypothetical protein L6452_16570 [Arctium lappa]
MEYNPLYDANKGFTVMASSFHDISDLEFQDNWGRVWVDIGTSDYFALDVLLNCLTVLSSKIQASGSTCTCKKKVRGAYYGAAIEKEIAMNRGAGVTRLQVLFDLITGKQLIGYTSEKQSE